MKKRFFLPAVAVTAALAITVCGGSLFASAAALPSPNTTTTVAEGITYNYYETTYAEAKQKIYTASVNTSAADSKYEVVVHAVAGTNGFTPSYVVDIAKDYEQKTGLKVYAGINADFFATVSGNAQPQQAFVENGVVLWQGPNYGTGTTKKSFGFDNKGNSVLGQLADTVDYISIEGKGGASIETTVQINPSTVSDKLAIYSTTGSKSFTNAKGYKLTIQTGEFGTNKAGLVGKKTSTTAGATSVNIASGEFAIVVPNGNEYAAWFETNFKLGATVTFNGKSAPAGIFEGMTQVVGGWADLVNGGNVISQSTLNTYKTDSGRSLTEKADRTFFGMKADGTFILTAVDGRNTNGSVGLTVMQEAQLAGDLGLYNAIELDGGGSTTMVIRQNDEIVQMNKPSDGGKRKVCNAVLIVEKGEKTPVQPPHVHSFGVWKSDATNHWKECSCGEKSELAAHVFDGDGDTECNICGYTRELTSTNTNGGNDEGGTTSQEKKGCSGSVAIGGAGALLLAVGALVLKKRR